MRPFNRSDLGRLYVSPSGQRQYTYLGDASLDALTSSASVAYNGFSYSAPSTGKTWAGTVTCRSGEALLALSRDFAEMDLLVTYGDGPCSVVGDSYAAATLIEGAVVSGESWSAMTTLSSDTRAPVSAACQLAARSVRRLPAGDNLRQKATLTGTVVAMCAATGRVYALCAQPSGAGTAILLRLAWSDNGRDWESTAISYSALAEPTSYSLTYRQFALEAWGDRVYIATGDDLLRVRAPAAGEIPATLYGAAVRPPGVAGAAVVGLSRAGGDLYALTASAGLWRISSAGDISILPMSASLWRTLAGDGEEMVLVRAAFWQRYAPGRPGQHIAWAGSDLAWMSSEGAPLAITTGGAVLTPSAGGAWVQRAALGGSLMAACSREIGRAHV